MNKWKLIAGVTLVFLLGGLVGSLGTGYYFKHRSESFRRGGSDRKAFIMKRLTRRLDLTESQVKKIDDIIDRMRDKHQNFLKLRRVEMRQFIAQSVAELKKELNPEQQEKLDKMVRRFEERKNRRGKPR